MPAPLHNQNAAKLVACDSHLHVRCLRKDKANWVRAAKHHGGLSSWVIAQLNQCAQNEVAGRKWARTMKAALES